MSKNKIVSLSDIHISTNHSTSWYQKNFHEPYLAAILDYVISEADSIQELILLGDIFDFWTYPPNHQPPEFTAILNANPNIFGVNGKLNQALTALKGNVTYVNGNHDMNVTKNDLHQIANSSNYQIKYSPDPIYYIHTAGGKKIAFTHGHIFTMFNAPYLQSEISPLPLGYFVTRAIAYMLNKTLEPGQTVADLTGQGAPNGMNLEGLVSSIQSAIDSGSMGLVDLVLDYITNVTEIPQNEPIILPNGQTTTIAKAKELYRLLQNQWIADWGGGKNGILATVKSAIADLDGTYIPWFAQHSALTSDSDLIVLGHTHAPKVGITNGLVGYANNGFECPSTPDIPSQTFTFTVVYTDKCLPSVYQVVKQNTSYQVIPYAVPQDSVIASISMDFSCYVIIDNTNGNSKLDLIESKANDGYYVVNPPKQILPGEQREFWIQDYPGLFGTKGSVTYSVNGQPLNLTYSCPTGISSNKCSGANFYTSNNGVNWVKLNEIKKSGHPFFVKFVL
ncbi:MAG: metallophosphoesterase [Nostoc sp.]|uniref:metallophosphoesterase n=1 Tax=Nostoc sp. TaxID=1180 RepID=UPI002FF1E051